MATDYRYDPRTDIPIAPGQQIREILEERGITQADFALRMGKTEKFISQLVNGKASLSYDTAIELERVLSVPASVWNNWESIYRDVLTRIRKEQQVAEQAEWVNSFPLKEMASHDWIARESSPKEQANELLTFFGVSSVQAYEEYWGAEKRLAARMSTAYSPETPAIAAWLRAGEREAEAVRTAPYSEAVFRQVLSDLRTATRLAPAEWLPLMLERCAAAGVAVVFIPDLPKTRLHAVSWWMTRIRAAIQLGLHYKTDDQVWFSFFHEAGHLLFDRSHSGISDLNGDPSAEERASAFAGDFLIPPDRYAAFTSNKRPTKAQVAEFAEGIGIAPSIVVGRLQRDGIVPYGHMQDMKTSLSWAE